MAEQRAPAHAADRSGVADMPSTARLRALAAAAWLALLLTSVACDRYPRDPNRTLQRVQGGEMRVGVAHDPPFVRLRPGAAPTGSEIALLRAFATSLDARIVWVQRGHGAMMRDLEAFRLDAVAGGHGEDSPWREHVAMTRPYRLRGDHGLAERRLALPPGENAWLLRFERFVERTRDVAGRRP